MQNMKRTKKAQVLVSVLLLAACCLLRTLESWWDGEVEVGKQQADASFCICILHSASLSLHSASGSIEHQHGPGHNAGCMLNLTNTKLQAAI
jgi:hypothetical protein